MADFSFSEDAELQKLNSQVLQEPEEFEHWEKLVRAAEAQEGGLHRNSSPGAIASTRDVYDKFLSRFPLFFGYWKKYADLEFSIAGTEAAEMVYERGVASIGISVDLWANYCGFKVETSHNADVIRELFERGADSVGLDFLAHPFWDKYLEFEERLESQDRIFAVLTRIINIPMHQYARYFERYRTMTANRPVNELAPAEVIEQMRSDIVLQAGAKQKSERDIEQELRASIDKLHLEIFQRTQAETTKRWTYESEVKRPYYHVTELDEPQLLNWQKYLDFEETEGEYARIKFLYERCVVTAANYQDFWLRYARWMLAQGEKQEEVRNIYQRASCLYVPILHPKIRLFWAQFEESEGRADVAVAIHEAVLMNMPNLVECIVSLANLHRRQYGLDSALGLLKQYVDSEISTVNTRGALTSERARMLWKMKGSTAEARELYQESQQLYLDCVVFWTTWLDFEIQQPTASNDNVPANYQFVTGVYNNIRHQSRLSTTTIQDLSATYFAYLKECGGKNAMAELMRLDKDIYGPVSVVSTTKGKPMHERQESAVQGAAVIENGGLGINLNETHI